MQKEKQGIPRENIPAVLCGLGAVICGTAAQLCTLHRVNVYQHSAAAFLLIATAVLTILTAVFAAAAVFCGLRGKRIAVRLAAAGLTLAAAGCVLFFGYVTPLPNLAGGRSDPVRDLRTAAEILLDDSAPVTETGFFAMQTYTIRFRSSQREFSSLRTKRFALKGESGIEIPSPYRENGIYTVQYSPVTRLPYSIKPYDVNCGENVLQWQSYHELYGDVLLGSTQLGYVWCKQLSRPFPRMLLRISRNGTTIAEQYFDADAEKISFSLTDSRAGTYSAQLFAVIIGPQSVPGQQCPISNIAVYEIS